MTLRRRIGRLEASRTERPKNGRTGDIAALSATLDQLADRKAAGCATAQHEIESLRLALEKGVA